MRSRGTWRTLKALCRDVLHRSPRLHLIPSVPPKPGRSKLFVNPCNPLVQTPSLFIYHEVSSTVVLMTSFLKGKHCRRMRFSKDNPCNYLAKATDLPGDKIMSSALMLRRNDYQTPIWQDPLAFDWIRPTPSSAFWETGQSLSQVKVALTAIY